MEDITDDFPLLTPDVFHDCHCWSVCSLFVWFLWCLLSEPVPACVLTLLPREPDASPTTFSYDLLQDEGTLRHPT